MSTEGVGSYVGAVRPFSVNGSNRAESEFRGRTRNTAFILSLNSRGLHRTLHVSPLPEPWRSGPNVIPGTVFFSQERSAGQLSVRGRWLLRWEGITDRVWALLFRFKIFNLNSR